VTGGGGFIGSHVVRRIVRQGLPVRVFDLPHARLSHLPKRRVELVRGDVRDPRALSRAAAGCGMILHLAANPNLYAARAAEFEEINHQGTLHVLRAAQERDVGRVVHVSTESILASPDMRAVVREDAARSYAQMFGPYLRSKWLAEEAARAAARQGAPVIIVNPAVPVGPGDLRRGPLTRLICQFARGQIRGYLPGTINLIDVRDAADGLWTAACRGRIGERYLLSGHNLTFREFFELLAGATGVPAPTWRVPYALALAGAWVEEQYCRWFSRREPMATVAGVRLTRRSFQFDSRRTRAELGLSLRPLLESLCDAIGWLQQQGDFELAAGLPSRSLNSGSGRIAGDRAGLAQELPTGWH
jgi:dihydroflavonol-4-reductase